ncbi:MAG TPA: hypothetical protein VKP30_13550, partial [Polyangiaceae bacterium]|nr:hypothetical protein [Polyangiaceae bacterium]
MRASSWFSSLLGFAVASGSVAARSQTYQQPAPGYQQPAPGYQQPAPGYQQPAPGYQQPAPGYQQPAPSYQQPAPGYQQSWGVTGNTGQLSYPTATAVSTRRTRDPEEIGALYVTGAAYGLGLGTWLATEIGLQDDPGTFLIAPLVLGVAAPIGVWALDQPKMKRGHPSAIAAGLMLGAGEGLGIWGTQAVRASSAEAWGFRGLSRAAAIGSTAGGAIGWVAGEFLQPPPMTSWLAVSGAFWGTAVGSMFTYGTTSGSKDWGHANDKTSVGGLVGYNVGMIAAGALGVATVPTATQVGWMWAGAGIGSALSLPIFLFYMDDGGPPARRGFIFMGTATTLGIIAGGLFSSGSAKLGRNAHGFEHAGSKVRSIGHIQGVLPAISSEHLGLSL